MFKFYIVLIILSLSTACKKSGVSDNRAQAGQYPEDISLNEDATAQQPAVISGSYLHLVCEDISSTYQIDNIYAAIGCRFLNEDESRYDTGLTEPKLTVHNAAGQALPVTRPPEINKDLWDDAFIIDRTFLSDMSIGSKDVPIKPYHFDINSISSMIKKLEQQRGVSGN